VQLRSAAFAASKLVVMPVVLYAATTNPGKLRDFSVAASEHGFLVEPLPGLREIPAPDENETTFAGNARLKAEYYSRIAVEGGSELLVLADDSGLAVDALGGAPGVWSARYAGEDATYTDNVEKLLRELAGVDAARRTARFSTVALARWPDGREVAALGEVEGVIADAAQGDAGFGYDPVFVPVEGDGRTFAEMSPAEKHQVSHRGRAFRTLADGLKVVQELEN